MIFFTNLNFVELTKKQFSILGEKAKLYVIQVNYDLYTVKNIRHLT